MFRGIDNSPCVKALKVNLVIKQTFVHTAIALAT